MAVGRSQGPRIVVWAAGLVCILAGGVWALQGAGVIGGSFMSGDPTWTWIGSAAAAFGIALWVFGVRLADRRAR